MGLEGGIEVDVVATERAGHIAVATQRDAVFEVAHLNVLPLRKHLRILAVAALSIMCCAVYSSFVSLPSFQATLS